MRIGGFVLETPFVLLTEKLVLPQKLPKPEEDQERTVQTSGTCVLTNARTGIWLAGTLPFLISKGRRSGPLDRRYLILSHSVNLAGRFRSAARSMPRLRPQQL